MAKNVADVSLLMSVIAGHDRKDFTSHNRPYNHTPSANIRGLRIGIPEEYFGKGVDRRSQQSSGVQSAVLKNSVPSPSRAASPRWNTPLLRTM